ncbi:MAG: class I SAM-dependent methyltransferase [Acidaminococcus provencensis]|uniref:class I SAM-dependent methyltransferase n=1 Tax=Acidaminococcus provencensis TaxID=2058289 RepID=UPI0023F02C04|nr:class I SAM-dependent methyltransferase [Acidaminococcus provencensis]MCH4095303.1 class I SAM-dependent methyltransferase [Acidaminococcus provencensis]
MDYAVTVGRKGGTDQVLEAQAWAKELHLPFLEREGGLEEMLRRYGLKALLAATRLGPQVYTEQGVMRYHPGMAMLRIKVIKRGEPDHLARACQLKPGDRFFDGTLGLGADAAVASFLVGPTGYVLGTEASPVIYKMTSLGLKNYSEGESDFLAALRRIEVRHGITKELLRQLPDNSFTVVYLDPMFQRPVEGSSSMTSLRPASYKHPLDREIVEEALRVAPRVVIKERFREVLENLGAQEIQGGRYSKVKYGIVRRNHGN